MSKQLLDKVMKAASVALLVGGMIGGASFVNNASANGVNGVPMYYNEHQSKYSKLLTYCANAENRYTDNFKKNVSESKLDAVGRAAFNRYMHMHHRRGGRKGSRSTKASAEKRALNRAKKTSRRAEEPLNHKTYRHAARHHVIKRNSKFVKSAYYRNTWNHAEKINKAGIRKDEKAMKYDQKKGYKSAVKYLQGKINYLNGYVRHDENMLNLK